MLDAKHFGSAATKRLNTTMQNLSKSIIQRGFSLIEMVVVLSIIAVLAGLITTQFSGESAKATRILSDVETIKKAALRYHFDTGRHPRCVESLWRRNGACNGGAGLVSWAGPYMDKLKTSPVSPTGYVFSGLLDSTHISLDEARDMYFGAPIVPGSGGTYILSISDLPSSLAPEVMKQCSGNASLQGGGSDFSTGNCYVDGPYSDGRYALKYFVAYIR